MKSLLLSVSATLLLLGLTSCSTNEAQDFEELQTKEILLKSYKVQKDINGRYSIDYTVNTNTDVETVKNAQTNSKDINLYSGTVAGKEKYNENLSINNNQLGVNFIENSQTKTSFIVEDEDIVLARGESNNEFLQEYSFFVNEEEKTVELDFKVREGVNVSFSYNEGQDIYEIHLKEGKTNGLSFSKIFVKNSDPLKIDFVNHLKSKEGSSVAYSKPKRPQIVIITDLN